jgi:hypothetical protein
VLRYALLQQRRLLFHAWRRLLAGCSLGHCCKDLVGSCQQVRQETERCVDRLALS